jgi:hypothetical protein
VVEIVSGSAARYHTRDLDCTCGRLENINANACVAGLTLIPRRLLNGGGVVRSATLGWDPRSLVRQYSAKRKKRRRLKLRVERNSQLAVTRAITRCPLEKKRTLPLALYQELEAVLTPRHALHRGP